MIQSFKTIALSLCIWLVLTSGGYAALPLNVRAGIHERSNRLVFDWTERVEYTYDKQGNLVTIRFSQQADPNIRSVKSVNPPFIRDLKHSNGTNGLTITFLVPSGSKIETFRLGDKVAFDVLRMDLKPLDFGNDTTSETSKPTTQESQETKSDTPETAQPKQEVAPPPQEKKTSLMGRLKTLADRLAEKPSDATLRKSSDTARELEDKAPEKPISGTVIRLQPKEMTKLAAFVRAGRLWLVLDKPLVGMVPDIRGEGIHQLSQGARRIDLKNGTAYVLNAPPENTVYSISRDQFEWVIALNASDKPTLPEEIPVMTRIVNTGSKDQAAQSAQVSLYAGEQPTVLSIRDTLVGDRLWIVPVRVPMGRITRMRQTPEYKMPVTFSGAVIVPQSDRVRVQTVKDMVVLSSKTDGSLRLSDEQDRELGLKEAAFTPLFRLDLPNVEEGSFTQRRQILEERLVEQEKPQDKAATLIDMSRLYIADGFGHEALGLLRIAAQELPVIESDLDYRALRGTAAALSGERTLAEDDLKSQSLQSYPAAKMWLGYALARDGEWQAARAAFIESGQADMLLPTPLLDRVALMQAETSLEAEDVVSTEQALKKIKDTKRLTAYEKAAYDYLVASILELQEKPEEARPMYEDVANSRDHMYRVKATLALVEQKLADKTISLKEAIDTLEGLRFSWRGDRLETDILRRLGQYYIDNKNYMDGLTVWRQAAGLSKNTQDTDTITQAMQETFKNLYIKGDSKELSPLQAVTVFERFRELTPSGKDGHLAMRHLADRLIEVDLLDQADSLLEKEMRQNATGVEAAKMGHKLAGLRLLNRDPNGALKALDESFQNGLALPEKLGHTRALLRARALADIGKTEDALYILNTVQTPESLRLKADISWRQNRWSDALSAMQKLLVAYRDDGKTAVDGPMPAIIMKMAIALALDDNTKGLGLLRAEYGPFMDQTSHADVFRMITHPSRGSDLADLDTLMKQVGEVELFQGFLSNTDS